jgi:hypothetical protein
MPGRFFLRTSLASLAVALASAGVEAWLLAARQPSPSILLRATPFAAAIGAIVAVLGACLATRSIDRWLMRLSPASLRPNGSKSPSPVVCRPTVLAAIAAVIFIAAAAINLNAPTDPHVDDQQAFIELAADIAGSGGWMQLWSRLQSGEYPEANRHPLYPILLSSRPSATYGRILSVTLAVTTLLACGWLVARRFSATTAALFVLLLAVNRSFAGFATSVVCESLMILLGGLAYLALLPPRTGSTPPRMILRSLLAAALLGLMYFTKATGLLFFGVFLLWLTWQSWPRSSPGDSPTAHPCDPFLPRGEPYQLRRLAIVLLCSLAAFLAVAHPLIVRNVRRFGNPFYNVNSLLLFADRYEEFDEMRMLGTTTAQARDRYLASHTVAQIIHREVSGLAWEAFIMLRSLGPHGLDDARILFGFPLAVCCLLSLMTDGRPATSLLVAWIFTSWIVFAWYVPIAAGDRFPIPLLVPVLAHAADGIVRLSSLRRPADPAREQVAL